MSAYEKIELGHKIIGEFNDTLGSAGLTEIQELAIFSQYKDVLSLCDKGLLGLAALSFDSIAGDPLLDINTTSYWKSRLAFANFHEDTGASYFEVEDSVLSEDAPIGLPNSTKMDNDIEVQKTWAEYARHTNTRDNKNLIHLGVILPSGNRSQKIEFSEAYLYFNALGYNNYKSHEYFISETEG
jgi:hypothetical protein